ncbi:TonB-dependent receptor [Lutibacter holmesii]|uniref:TonB-dependent receptor n=1 Tax=Lutibacter holmesii TaxID=1137985 RepID=A0ABW3WMF5_9FLAO
MNTSLHLLIIQNNTPMRKLFTTLFLLLFTSISFAQETKKDTLKTEEITVVKPYSPTISEAFKIKENPTIDTQSFQKEQVNYSIFSVPVASTFTPSKGKAQGLKRAPKERLFDNYVSAGFGNYTTPSVQAFLHAGNPRYNDFGLFLNYHSSEGGINDVLLDDNFSNIKAAIYYKQFERDFNWKVTGDYNRQQINYYGLPTDITFTENVLSNMDEEQVYNNISAGGSIIFDDAIFQSASIEVSNFFDSYNSNELQLLVKPSFEFPISTEIIKTDVLVAYLNGKFDQDYTASNEIKYSFLNLGVNPNFEVLRDDLSINLGVKLYYTFNLENSSNAFKAYPNVTASYKVVDDVFILLAGVTGDLIQNSYEDFTQANPFVSPTLNVQQTDQQYKAFIGAKGKLASNIGYNVNVNYVSEKDKALFVQNPTKTNGSILVSNAYEAGNSFQVVYDNVNTINFLGEINIEVSKEFQVGAGFHYANYSTTDALEAWNLPDFTATISGEYKTEKWYVGTKIFFRGATKDYVITYGDALTDGTVVKNDAYIDLNFNGGYIFTNRLSVYGKINNAIGDNYNRFTNYPVQSIQFLAGVTYKFDIN